MFNQCMAGSGGKLSDPVCMSSMGLPKGHFGSFDVVIITTKSMADIPLMWYVSATRIASAPCLAFSDTRGNVLSH